MIGPTIETCSSTVQAYATYDGGTKSMAIYAEGIRICKDVRHESQQCRKPTRLGLSDAAILLRHPSQHNVRVPAAEDRPEHIPETRRQQDEADDERRVAIRRGGKGEGGDVAQLELRCEDEAGSENDERIVLSQQNRAQGGERTVKGMSHCFAGQEPLRTHLRSEMLGLNSFAEPFEVDRESMRATGRALPAPAGSSFGIAFRNSFALRASMSIGAGQRRSDSLGQVSVVSLRGSLPRSRALGSKRVLEEE